MRRLPWLPFTARSFLGFLPERYSSLLGYGFLHGQITGVTSALLVFMRQRLAVSDILLFPVITAALWPASLPSFSSSWQRHDALHSALQAMDITGVCGLDFIIALVNILIYRILRLKSRKIEIFPAAAALIMILLWFGYGFVSMRFWRTEISSWPSAHRPGSAQPVLSAAGRDQSTFRGTARICP
jgi:apolipoprotein N-acyltransferase